MTIVVGYSDTELGAATLDRAVAEAELRDTSLVLVSQAGLQHTGEVHREYEARREEVATAMSKKAEEIEARGVRCETRVPRSPSSASEAILDAANQVDAELIVVGLERRSPVGKAFFGSIAQDIILQADAPVLGVKAPAAAQGS